MVRTLALSLTLSLLLVGCGTTSEDATHFGAPFTIDGEAVAVAEALPKVDTMLDGPVKISATVDMSCRKKGCWMTLVEAPDMRVTFKDYGFFVPTVSDGAHAVMEGVFVKETVDEATRRHFAEDGGATPEELEAIVGDVEKVNFVATGVALTNLPAADDAAE